MSEFNIKSNIETKPELNKDVFISENPVSSTVRSRQNSPRMLLEHAAGSILKTAKSCHVIYPKGGYCKCLLIWEPFLWKNLTSGYLFPI